MPKVSILTAVRADTPDKVTWLRECVESVKAQDFQDWEMVVVDDESPLLVGEALHPHDERILYARANPRAGTAMCRNTAAALATGEAFLALDADDKLPPGALATLWEAWSGNRDRIVYGNAQQFGVAERHLPFPLFNTIHDVLNLSGIVPVTAMHSPKVWEDAGGWKQELEHGLEDVEYWISAAAVGHCGLKVEATTLLYRKHNESRSARMRREHTQSAMEDRIRERHKEIYAGRLPMGCCGGSSRAAADIPQPRKEGTRLPPSNTGAGDTIWVRYNGALSGTFGVASPNVKGHVYDVQGMGHVFEIYAVDASFLQRQGRGQHFTVGVPSPVKEEPVPIPEPAKPEYVAPKPELARIERMPVRTPPPLAEVIDVTEQKKERAEPLAQIVSVSDEIKAVLKREGWTIPALARATVDELTPYKGIAEVKAKKLIEEAKTLWGI